MELPRLIIITNGNYFAAVGLRSLLAQHNIKYNVLVIRTRALRRLTGRRPAVRALQRWGYRYLGFKVVVNLILPLAGRLLRRDVDVQAIGRRNGARVIDISDVNSAEAQGIIRDWRPQLLVSFSCPYKLGTSVLSLPSLGALNVHSSLLPAYAGVSTYVHVLAEGACTTGVTIHEMVEQFDAGLIVRQGEINVEPGITAFRLFRAQCFMAATLLDDAVVDVIRAKAIEGRQQDLSSRSYRSDPKAADVKSLRRNGYRLMSWTDFAAALRDTAG